MIKRLIILFNIILNIPNGAMACDGPGEGSWDFALPGDTAGESSSKRAKFQGAEECSDELAEYDINGPSFDFIDEGDGLEALFSGVEYYTASIPNQSPMTEFVDHVEDSPQTLVNHDVSKLFQHIRRDSINAICLFFNGQSGLNRFILSLLSPQDVKSIMGASRRGYWLGRTRGYVKVAKIDEQEQDAFSVFIGRMVSDTDYPLKVLDLTYFQSPERIFSSLNQEQLEKLKGSLVSYAWNGNYTYGHNIMSSSITAQLKVLLGCSHLKSLSMPGITTERRKSDLRMVRAPDPVIAEMAKSFKELEELRIYHNHGLYGRYDIRLIDFNTILREFKCLRVLEGMVCEFYHNGSIQVQDPFCLFEESGNPDSRPLSLPLLEEICINGYLHNMWHRSLIQLCPNIKKISVKQGRGVETYTLMTELFLLSETLQEYRGYSHAFDVTLTRAEPGAAIHLNVKYTHSSSHDSLNYFKELREVFANAFNHHAGLVVKEVCLANMKQEIMLSRSNVLSLLANRIADVEILHLPEFRGYSLKSFKSFLDKLTNLRELDFSSHPTGLMPDAAYTYAAGKVKHMNISNMANMTPELVEHILAVRHLDVLTLSLLTIRENGQDEEIITEEMVQNWRNAYPQTQITFPSNGKLMIVNIKPKKPIRKIK